MKKLLLSLAFITSVSVSSFADTVTLQVAEASDIDGTEVAEKRKEDGSLQEARKIQPLVSFKIGDYTFATAKGSGSTEPAIYYPDSKKPEGSTQLRVYKNNTLTITAPNNEEISSVSYVLDGKTESVNMSGSFENGSYKWTNTTGANIRIVTLNVTVGQGGSTPVDPDPIVPTEGVQVSKSNQVSDGQVAFVFEQGYVSTFASNKAYGYWMATASTLADDMTVSNDAIFTIKTTDKGTTITDSYGRVMGWKSGYWSFNAYDNADTEEGNCYWNVTMVDGKVKFTNKAKSADDKEVYLAGKAYNSDYEMCPTDREDQALPFLYVVKSSGVVEIDSDDAAEAVYYNLQGVKVTNPEKGLYIKVQG
ncbi:MAG: hypothetical protein K2K97_07275, partial [Muribaculaceae bacterium]|nr:hypothetical protein [Muribaculaceae bacterium]